jgi:hypothetical protein
MGDAREHRQLPDDDRRELRRSDVGPSFRRRLVIRHGPGGPKALELKLTIEKRFWRGSLDRLEGSIQRKIPRHGKRRREWPWHIGQMAAYAPLELRPEPQQIGLEFKRS